MLGESLGGQALQVGPVKAPNFPWVLLGRAWVHHHLVSERNHARREAVSMSLANAENLMDRLPDELRKTLASLFKKLAGTADERTVRELESVLDLVLEIDPGGGEA